MSCLTVNTQVTRNVCKPVIKIESAAASKIESKKIESTPYQVHYPDLNAVTSLTDYVLRIVMQDLDNSNKLLLLHADELKEVVKIVTKADDVIIEAVPPTDAEVDCCGITTEVVYDAVIKKILVKYNNKDCLEDLKMHYNAVKIITSDYKIDIDHCIASCPKEQ